MARAIWSGSISFGLLNVPVRLYSAVARRNIALREIRESDSSRIKHRRVAEGTDEEVPYDEIVKAYEITPGRYVPLSKDEMSALAPEKTRAIDVQDFVEVGEIDPMYFDSPYYLGPADGAEKAYSLLAAAMEASGKAAIARFVFRNKEHLAAIRATNGALTLTTMRFADEVVPASELDDVLPQKKPEVAKKEQEMAEALIDSLSTELRTVRLPRRVPRAAALADRNQSRRQGDRCRGGRGAAGDEGAGPDGGARGIDRGGQRAQVGRLLLRLLREVRQSEQIQLESQIFLQSQSLEKQKRVETEQIESQIEKLEIARQSEIEIGERGGGQDRGGRGRRA